MVVYSKKYFIFLKVGKIGEKGSQYLDIYSLCYYSPACLLHSTLGDILFSGGKFLFICQVKPSTSTHSKPRTMPRKRSIKLFVLNTV